MERIRKRLYQMQAPVKWLFYGDSITHGACHTYGWRDYVELFAERVRYELNRPRDIVIKTATNGNTTRDLLSQYDWFVAPFSPDVVFVMIGMNDCNVEKALPLDEYRANLKILATRMRLQGIQLVLQTTCPLLPGTAPEREPYFQNYMQEIRNLATCENIPLIDHARFWERRSDAHYVWMNNEFHPNEFGHRIFAFEIFRQLGIFDPVAATCRLFVPFGPGGETRSEGSVDDTRSTVVED